MKKEVLFFTAGVLTAVSVTALAAQLEVNPNSFPITLNGSAVDIEGYNLNGNTYFKLRDIGDKLGFNVDFENDTIVITKNDVPSDKPTDKPSIPGIGGQLPDGEGVTPEQMLTELKERLEKKVASGEMTQAEADEILNSIGTVPTENPQNENGEAGEKNTTEKSE